MTLPPVWIKLQESLPVGEDEQGNLFASDAPIAEMPWVWDGECSHTETLCRYCVADWRGDYQVLSIRFDAGEITTENWEVAVTFLALLTGGG